MCLTSCDGGRGAEVDTAGSAAVDTAEGAATTEPARTHGTSEAANPTTGPGDGHARTTSPVGELPDRSDATLPHDAAASRSGVATVPPGAQVVTAAPGVYAYETDGYTQIGGREIGGAAGSRRSLPEVTTLEVKPAEGDQQRSIRDMRDENGDGVVTTTGLLNRDTGIFLEQLEIVARDRGTAFTFRFDLTPPALVLPTPPHVGFHIEFSARSSSGDVTAHIKIEITGRELLVIDDTKVDTFVIRSYVVFEGDIDGEMISSENFSPEHSLRVREEVVRDITLFGLVTDQTEYTATLRSLRPR
jgi:hypothetical protein